MIYRRREKERSHTLRGHLWFERVFSLLCKGIKHLSHVECLQKLPTKHVTIMRQSYYLTTHACNQDWILDWNVSAMLQSFPWQRLNSGQSTSTGGLCQSTDYDCTVHTVRVKTVSNFVPFHWASIPEFTTERKLNGNRMETERNDSEHQLKETERNWKLLLTPNAHELNVVSENRWGLICT